MANDKDQPELPRVEPEIIPPDRAASGPGRGAAMKRVANLTPGTAITAVGEALALGEAVSVDLPLAQLAYERLAAGLGLPHTEKET